MSEVPSVEFNTSVSIVVNLRQDILQSKHNSLYERDSLSLGKLILNYVLFYMVPQETD